MIYPTEWYPLDYWLPMKEVLIPSENGNVPTIPQSSRASKRKVVVIVLMKSGMVPTIKLTPRYNRSKFVREVSANGNEPPMLQSIKYRSTRLFGK